MKPALQPDSLTSEFVAFRRASFFGAILATTGLGIWLLWRSFLPEGISALEWIQLVLFALLFQQISTGFWLVMFGFLTLLTGGDRAAIEKSLPAVGSANAPPTAVILPIFNEDVDRVFRGVESMWQGLASGKGREGFDFFILSDSNRPENWIAEEVAWLDLCKRHDAFGRIFYRKRRVPRNSKSGNVADFCRRWGARYRYMIVLDADSIMTGNLMQRLVAMMEQNPRVGLIQTAPQLALGRTLFRRMQQFASKVYAPLFAAGSNYWHLFAANYWGHNAIIRVRPFIEHCDLPELPEPDQKKRHIFSHDTVEAALMRRAGYDVWFATTEEGSYEEGPPNLADSLGRDRRWCMGNLQHFWFLFAPGIDFANRFHIWTGLMSYLSSPLWLLFLITGVIDLAFKNRFSLLSALPGSEFSYSGGAVQVLMLATFALLFLPKILALLTTLPTAKRFGGMVRLTISALTETLVWTLLAPAIMLYYTRFVILNILGITVRWGNQNRSDDVGPGLRESLKQFWLPPVTGVISLTALIIWSPVQIWLLSPIIAGWLCAPFLAWLTGQPKLGDITRRLGLFAIPEENPKTCPPELAFVSRENPEVSPPISEPPDGFAQAVVDPLTHALHVTLLRQRRQPLEKPASNETCERLLKEGPAVISPQTRYAILWDPEALRWLHHEVWSRPKTDIHPWWAENLGIK
jgi:membrane glycosyltransferase